MGDMDERMSLRVFINTGRFQFILRRRNMTHLQLARDLSTSANYLSQIVNGHKGVSPRMGRRITSHPAFRGRKWDDLFKMGDCLDV